MNKIGKFGEDIACKYLKGKGYEIVERNYAKKWGEIDIVAKMGKTLCFVEVKTIKNAVTQETVTHVTGEYKPEYNLHSQKLRKFSRIIQTYLEDKHKTRADWTAALLAIKINTETKIARVCFMNNLVLEANP